MDKYFVYCSENGYESFETEIEAINEADIRIDNERDNAFEGWDENVDTIVWGEIKAFSKRIGERPVSDSDMVSQDCEIICDFIMSSIEE